jgi:hypothetical protein
VFVAPAELRAQAARPAIDAGKLQIDPSRAERVVIIRGGARVTLDATKDGFTRRAATAEDDDAGDDRLPSAVAAFRAREALHAGSPAPEEEFDRPTLEIETFGAGDDGAGRSTIVVGAARRGGSSDDYYARVSGIDATFAVPRRCVDAILRAP